MSNYFKSRVNSEQTKKNVFSKTSISSSGINSNVPSLENISCFPELITKTQEIKTFIPPLNKNSFTDIVKIEKEEEVKNEDSNLGNGWVVLNRKKLVCKNQEITGEDTEEPNKIMNRLNELYEKWKTEYINNWGLDEYEYHYRFQNYDYEYFDKLDAQEELEQHDQTNNIDDESDDLE